jgi:eukaryotic-like serine/threonine-protein kinase
MKTCPTCRETYPDNISFCSHDGAALTAFAAWTEGTIIRGRYRILSRVGGGGMGEVYKALHTGFDELRALKVISPELMADQTFVKRFKHEAFITRKLQHPNAVRVDDIDEAEDGRPFIVMEYIEGKSLKDLIEQEGPLAAQRVCTIAKQVAAALDAAHQLGMVHRDIKPDNIVMVLAPEGEQAKVLDFGIAKIKEARLGEEGTRMTLTDAGVVVGTPQYMSPEQAQGMRGDELDARSDLYSLGVVMYEMLTGQLPFKAETTMDMMLAHMQKPPRPVLLVRSGLQIPETLSILVMRILQKKREMRPQSAAALIEEIWRVEKGMPLSPLRPSQPSVATPAEAGPKAAPSQAPHTLVGPALPRAPAAQPSPPPPAWPAPRPAALDVSDEPESSPWGRRALIALLLAGLAWGGWRLAARRPSTLAEWHRAHAQQLEKQRLFAQAEQEYRAAAELDPQNASLRAALGNVLIQQNKWDDGVAAYRDALRLNPDDPASHNNLGVSLASENNLVDAIAEYREALRLKPDYVEAHDNLGSALEKHNDLDESIAEYREVLRLRPGEADGHYHLGIALYRKGAVDEAIAEYREAIRLRPGFALAHFSLGGALYNQGDHEGGLGELRTAYMLAPDNPEIRASYQKLLEK